MSDKNTPKPIDLEQISRTIGDYMTDDSINQHLNDRDVEFIANQLRQVWNARGAADAQALTDLKDWEEIGDVLRKLDR